MGSPAPNLTVGRECLRLGGKILLAGLVGVSLVIALAAYLPDDFDPGTAAEMHAATPTDRLGHRVRQIQCTPDGQQAWVLRFPAEWELIDVTSGAVRFQQAIADRVSCQVQRVPGSVTTVVYSNERGRFICPLEENASPKSLFPDAGEFVGMIAAPESPVIALYDREVLELWSIAEGERKSSLTLDCPISKADWSNDGRWLFLIRTNGRFEIRDGETLALRQSQTTSHFNWRSLAWASGSQHVLACNDFGIALVWDLAADQIVELWTGVPSSRAIAIAPHGDFIVCPDAHNDVWLHSTTDTTAGRRYFGTAATTVTALCVLWGGECVLVGTADGSVECWSTTTGLPLWNGASGKIPMDFRKATPSQFTDAPVAQGAASCASTRS